MGCGFERSGLDRDERAGVDEATEALEDVAVDPRSSVTVDPALLVGWRKPDRFVARDEAGRAGPGIMEIDAKFDKDQVQAGAELQGERRSTGRMKLCRIGEESGRELWLLTSRTTEQARSGKE